jgi:cytochrome c-type protein NapC
MPLQTTLIIALVFFSIVLIGVLIVRPGITATGGGKIMAFVVLLVLPILCGAMGVSSEVERSKTTEFCLSCHIMESYGQSLHADDPSYLAAAHFQNHRVPADEACYTCHTNYAMFGSMKAKMAGLRHVYVYYLTKPPAPENIKLHEPYKNRECLHCHLGARSFEQGAVHTADPDLLPSVKVNKLSCISSGCHETVHNVGTLSKVKMWSATP